MPSPLDRVDPVKLAETAERIRVAHSAPLPELRLFNSTPCDDHAELQDPDPLCRKCGIKLRRHQRTAIMWLWLKKKGLIADPVGTGKTHIITGLFSVLAQVGPELGRRSRGKAVVVCEPSAMRQWQREIRRAVPSLVTELAEGSRQQRADRYVRGWDVLIMGHHMLLRDAELIRRLGITILVVDDVDPLRHSETKTAGAIKKLGDENPTCERIILLNATPLQKKLMELYDTLSQLGMTGRNEILGPRDRFERRYTVKEPTQYYAAGRLRTQMSVVGHQNLGEFQQLIAPRVMRRTIDQIDDVELPAIQPEDVWLTLHPAQRARYEELQRGVLTVLAEHGTTIKHATALTKLLYSRQICEGLSAIGEPDGPGTSVKFDWLLGRLTGDWSGEAEGDPGEKVVAFVNFKDGVRAISNRLKTSGIGHVLIWGEERRPQHRDAALEEFRDSPECRVLVGTSAIEKSLNLQVARHLVNVDTLPNPARMTQLSGRIRRQGSRFRTVYVHNLLTTDTHEERALAMLQNEAALAGAVWGEEDQLFRSLTPVQMLQLIAPQGRRSRVPAVRVAS